MDLYNALLIGLATFAVTFLVRFTDGPFNLLLKFRVLIGIIVIAQHDENGVVYEEEYIGEGFFSKLFSCMWCLSTWVAGIIILMLQSFNRYTLIVWLASIAISGLLHEHVDED